MKRMHTFRLCTLFYISVILLQLICPAKAINSEDFSLIAGEETDGITSAKNISLEEIPIPANQNQPIISFAVSENQLVALLLGDATILVLDSGGSPIKAFSFNDAGTAYIMWAGEHLQLLLVRSNSILEFTLNAIPVKRVRVDRTAENEKLKRQLRAETTIKMSSVIYQRENTSPFFDFFSGYYSSQLVRIDSNGNRSTLYDASKSFNTRIVFFLCVGIALIFGIPLVFLISYLRSRKHKAKGNTAC